MNRRLNDFSTAIFSTMLILIGIGSGTAHAVGLTYVDADDLISPNIAPLSAVNPSSASNVDDLWGFRAFGAGSTIYESGLAEDSPQLTQTVTGLLPNTSYDVYGVFWTNPSQNWMLQVGTTVENLTVYNLLGPDASVGFQNATPGKFATAAIWDAPPMANGSPIFSQGTTLVMMLGYGGEAMTDGSGNLEVLIDDLDLGSTRRTWFDGVAYVAAGTPVVVEAAIDRSSGQLSISNPTDTDFQIKSYEVVSAAGSLNASQWSTIASGSFDVDPWSVTTPADPPNTFFTTQLAEAEEVGATVPGGTLAAGGGSLNFGNVWQKTPFQDVFVRLTLTDDSVVTLSPTYSGSPILSGNFDAIGDISIDDFETMMTNMFSDLSALTLAEAFSRGDITGDGVVDYVDFRRFQLTYDDFHGEGAFANMVAAVPEPGTWALALVAISFGIGSRMKRFRSSWLLLLACMTAMLAIPSFSVATPVTGWIVDPLLPGPNSPILSDLETDSPTIGDGSLNNAEAIAFFAPFTNIALADGEQIELTGTVEFVGMKPIATDFRWGLFKDDGVAPDTAGWLGFFAMNASELTGGLLVSKNPTGSNFANTTFASTTGGRATTLGQTLGDNNLPSVDGMYNLSMTVARFGDVNEVRTALVSTTNDYVFRTNSFTEANPVRRTFDFDRVGILLGGSIDVDQAQFGNVDVTKSAVQAPTLQVESDGGVSIVNNASQSFDLNFYEITSASGSLNDGGWVSFDDGESGDPFGDGWDEAAGSSANRIGEGNFASSTTLAMEGSIDLGNAFSMGGTQDLVFRYATTDGILLRGFVEYDIAPAIDGDHNGDGFVNAADYVLWRDTMSDNIGGYNDWRANFGASAGSGASTSAVPEPGSWALLILGLAIAGFVSGRRSF